MTPQPAPTRAIRRPVRGRALRKLLWKRLGVPRALVHPALSAAKMLVAPREVQRRRRLAAALPASPLGDVPAGPGFIRFAPDALPGMEAVLRRCRDLFEERRGGFERSRHVFNPSKQDFLLAVLSGDEFGAEPDLVRFMVSRPLLDAVSRYLGTVPLLAGAALWWSPPNQSATSSQLYHLDNEDDRQIKVLLNVEETLDDQGPFTFLPADVSAGASAALSEGRGRLDDACVEARIGGVATQRLTGPPGSGALVDTARCLHYGSRGNRRERLVLIFQFLRFEAPTESTFRLQVPADLLGDWPDLHQRLALGLR